MLADPGDVVIVPAPMYHTFVIGAYRRSAWLLPSPVVIVF